MPTSLSVKIEKAVNDFHAKARGLFYGQIEAYRTVQALREEAMNECNQEEQDMLGQTRLHWAVLRGDIESIQSFAIAGNIENLIKKDRIGQTALNVAAYGGNVEAMSLLMSEPYKLDPKEKDQDGRTALHLAAEGGHVEAMRLLMSEPYNLDPKEKDKRGQTALHWSTIGGHVSAMELLMGDPYKLDPKEKDEWGGRNALQLAAYNGHVSAMELLMSEPYKLDPKEKDWWGGRNALQLAAYNGHVSAMELLMSEPYKLDPKEKDQDGRTVLHAAAEGGHVEAMRLLMSEPYNLDPKEKDKRGQTALHWSTIGGHVSAMELLMGEPYKLDPKEKDKWGKTALHLASHNGHVVTMELLMCDPYHLDPKEKDEDGRTALHWSTIGGHVAAMEFFLLNYPKQTKACWVKDNNGDMPDDLGRSMNPRPLVLLKQHLMRITMAIAEGNRVTKKEYDLLEAFSDEWRRLLLGKNDELNLQVIVSSVLSLPEYQTLKKIVTSLQELVNLKALDTIDKALSYACLDRLLFLTQASLDKNNSAPFFKKDYPKLFLSLKACFLKLPPEQADELNPEVIRTINVIINDYERTSTHEADKPISDILQSKLLATGSISALRPKPSITTEADVREENYLEHFNRMQNTFSGLPVSAEIRRITQETILPGIQHLIENRKDIVAHVTQHYGKLYYLAPGHAIVLSKPTESELSPNTLYLYAHDERLCYSIKTPRGDRRDALLEADETLIAEINAQIAEGCEVIDNEDLKQSIAIEMAKVGCELKKDALPLHTDHAPIEDAEAFDQMLHRLIKNIIGAYYCCETAGQLPEFFNQLSHGNCLEGRIRDTLQWAIGFSEIKSFDEFMANAIADYSAYEKVMSGATEESLCFIEPALDFIMQRYNNFPCQKHDTYAPNNEVTSEGVTQYLSDVLCYEQRVSHQQSAIM